VKSLTLLLVVGAGVIGYATLPAWAPVASSYPLLSPIVGSLAATHASLQPALSDMAAKLPSLLPGDKDVSPTSYRARPAQRGDIATTVRAAGTLNALVVVDVGSQISGLVKELYADFNSKVTEGQVIARVDPATYEARVAQAQAELEMAETQIAVQRAKIERQRAELETAQSRHASAEAEARRTEIALDGAAQEMGRKRLLAQRNIISVGEWERIENAHKSAHSQVAAGRATKLSHAAAVRAAKAALDSAEAQLANMLAQVKQKEAVLRQAKIDLDRTYIRAPVTGTVVNRAVAGGQTLAASLQSPVLFTIAQDLTRMQVEASVVEADIGRFAVGQPVTFTVDAYPDRTFEGFVTQIRKAPQIVQNVVTYVVVASAENPEEFLLPGMTANLQVVTATRKNVLQVPNAALRFRPRSDAPQEKELSKNLLLEVARDNLTEVGFPGQVFVLGEEGEPRPVALRLGITDGRKTEVLAGKLNEGQPVITGVEAALGTNPDGQSILVKFRLR
jgi:HlyD family secretion protein